MIFLKKHYNKLLNYFFFMIFIILNFILMLYHEPWRDEIHAWTMAEFLSIKDLFIVSRFDGHPVLWHLILMPFTNSNLSINLLAIDAAKCVFPNPDSPVIISPLVCTFVIHLLV